MGLKSSVNKVTCECGRQISLRVLTRHVQSAVKSHSDRYVKHAIETVSLHRKYRSGWLKKEGENAIAQNWLPSVLRNETNLSDWVFQSPRKRGLCTPIFYENSSRHRIGKGNPAIKNKPMYKVEELANTAQAIWKTLEKSGARLPELRKALEKSYPLWSYSLSGMFGQTSQFRGDNLPNKKLAYLLEITVKELISIAAKDRGKAIKIAQARPATKRKMLRSLQKPIKNQTARGYVSRAHLELFYMIQSVDPDSRIEKQMKFKSTWKSYDIFSPKINALIEMHGRVWHDPQQTKPKIKHLAQQNSLNDKEKEDFAKKMGYNYIVFWDDMKDTWEQRIEQLYGKRPEAFEKIKNKAAAAKKSRKYI